MLWFAANDSNTALQRQEFLWKRMMNGLFFVLGKHSLLYSDLSFFLFSCHRPLFDMMQSEENPQRKTVVLLC